MKRVVCFAALLASIPALAMDYLGIESNASYMSNLKYSAPSSSFALLDVAKQNQVCQQYTDLSREYDVKSQYGLMSQVDQYRYFNDMSNFSQNVYAQIRSYQFQSNRDRTMRKLRDDPTILYIENSSRVPAAIVGAIWGIYKGTSYPIKISNSTITPGASVVNREASLAVSSPVVSTSFNANQQAVSASVSRGIVEHVSVSFTDSIPVQNNSLPNKVVGASYGINL